MDMADHRARYRAFETATFINNVPDHYPHNVIRQVEASNSVLDHLPHQWQCSQTSATSHSVPGPRRPSVFRPMQPATVFVITGTPVQCHHTIVSQQIASKMKKEQFAFVCLYVWKCTLSVKHS